MGFSPIFVPYLGRYLHFLPNFFGVFVFSSYLCRHEEQVRQI